MFSLFPHLVSVCMTTAQKSDDDKVYSPHGSVKNTPGASSGHIDHMAFTLMHILVYIKRPVIPPRRREIK